MDQRPLLFGHQLKQARRSAGLTQEALAARAGVSARLISDLERLVQHTPRPATLRLLIEALPIAAAERTHLYDLAARQDESAAADQSGPPVPRLSLPGREAELAAIEALLRGGHGSLFIEGEAGMGKTCLLNEAQQLAARLGWRVVWRGTSSSGSTGSDPVLAAVRREVEGLSPSELRRDLYGCDVLMQVLAEHSETRSPEGEAIGRADLLAPDVARHLRNVAGPAGTLLVLDDLHTAGPRQLDVLARLVEAAHQEPIAILGAHRTSWAGHDVAIRDVLGPLMRAHQARRCTLGSLSRAAALALLADRPKQLGQAWQARVLHDCGGVPFYLQAMVDEPSTDVPWIIQQDVLDRIRLLPDALPVLGSVVVAGELATVPLLLAMVGGSRSAVLATVEAACRERLLVEDGPRFAFAYPVLRRVVEGELTYARRAVLHERLRMYLGRFGSPNRTSAADPEVQEQAHHLAVLRAGRRARSG